jgi:predicted DNA-binding transcriptional regulator YafY
VYTVKICQAISKQLMLHFEYDGKFRTVEPHTYGHDKTGNELLRAWQMFPEPEDWRSFRLDKATSIAISTTRFLGPRVGYVRNDKAMGAIYCQL